jgi:DNA-binding SARP family transcriptional activator
MHVFLKYKIIVFCLFINFLASIIFSQEPEYGLKFNSNNYEPEMRTGLNLSPDNYFTFSKGFSMTFEAKFHFKDVHIYGYIFRIINKKGNIIDFVMGDTNLVFSMPLGNIVTNNTLTEVNLVPGQWIPIRLDIDFESEELKIAIGEYIIKWNTAKVREFKDVKIVLGKSDYQKKQVIDVPDMTIKNLEITDRSKNLLYSWKFSKHTPDGVYDDIRSHFAKCDNPNWVLDYSGIWKKEISFTTGANPYLAYDSDRKMIAVADQHSFYTFALEDNRFEKYTVNKKIAYKISSNQMIYNILDSNFYIYNLVKENEAREFVPFDLSKGKWGNTTAHQHNTDYRHHNRYFSSKYDRLYLFGGYGHLKYKEGVLIYDVTTKTWSKAALKGDNISPRYLSGMGKIDEDHLLLFGGYGSETGNQALQSQFYYDCYVINIKTMEAKKIWTMEYPSEDFVVSNSLIVDTTNHCFYALLYPSMKFNSAISLGRFSLEKPEYEIMADEIPLKFNDVLSYVDLFFDDTNQKLITAAFFPVADSTINVSIYSLAYPPLKHSDLYQSQTEKKEIPWLTVICIFLIFNLLFVYFRFIRKKRALLPVIGNGKKMKRNYMPILGVDTIRQLQNQAIYLFGAFQVTNKEGNDVAPHFKPLLKNLFLLILLNTIKNGKGISFTELKDILWFDKTEESANNNRGVSLNKIRHIFENIGKIEFNKKGAYWQVELGKEIYCDYYEALILIKKIKEDKEIDIESIKRLLSITATGALLPDIQTEWVDAFKSCFSNDFVDLILQLINRKEPKFSDDIYINMANALFIHDPLNEDALRLKCSVLVKMGKNGLARNTYMAFTKEYFTLFGTKYTYSFDQIVAN